jgi:selenide,water dikinase
LDDERKLVVTTDFFTPIVDDPYDYGRIAAANALSDLYAMGATPAFALNVVAMPTDLPPEIVREIIRGGAEKTREAGAVIAGGHSVQDREPKYGLVAVGFLEGSRLMTKSEAEVGDVVLLTKPLGTGVTTTALRSGKASQEDSADAVMWMSRLNRRAANLAREFEIRCATDITGFGLLGHGIEVSESSRVRLEIALRSVPFLSGALRYAKEGHFPGGSLDNQAFFRPRVEFSETIQSYAQLLLFDAQTSGGLLLMLPPSRWEEFASRADDLEVPVWPIGQVVEGAGIQVLDQESVLSAPSVRLEKRIVYYRGT